MPQIALCFAVGAISGILNRDVGAMAGHGLPPQLVSIYGVLLADVTYCRIPYMPSTCDSNKLNLSLKDDDFRTLDATVRQRIIR